MPSSAKPSKASASASTEISLIIDSGYTPVCSFIFFEDKIVVLSRKLDGIVVVSFFGDTISACIS